MNHDIKNKQGQTEREFLASYQADKYERPSVTVDMLIFTVSDREERNYRKLPEKALRLLLVKRGDHPFLGKWALPGGFVKVTESLDAAARRELKEETNVDNVYMEQLYTWGEVDRDPRTRIISTAYLSLADSTAMKVISGDDADDAKWFTVSYKLLEETKTLTENGYHFKKKYQLSLNTEMEKLIAFLQTTKTVQGKEMSIQTEILESDGIAFDHAKIIAYGIERLRNKVEYTDIAFHLMPEYFTLTALQQVYEVILDEELLKANFRRKLANMVTETNKFTKDAGHRPSKLYTFNTGWEGNK